MKKGIWHLGVLIIAVIVNLGHTQSQEQHIRPESTFEHEYYLSYRTCFAWMIGLDWIKDALSKVMEQSIRNFQNRYHHASKVEFTSFEEKIKV